MTGRRFFRICGVFFLLAAVLQPLAAQDLTGEVVRVTDGDTFQLELEEVLVKIRLHGIDTPELDQPYGDRAREFAALLILGRDVGVQIQDIDRYGRIVGTVILPDGRVLNHELVAAGLAWWYRRYASGDTVLRDLEQEARTAERGLWANRQAIAPWDWRQGARPGGQNTD